MAEKKKPTKKKNPRFGGKRDLKDMDKSNSITFGDTFLGDLLGFDKDGIGLQGRAGLLKSLKGARRKKPNLVQVPSTTKKKTTVKKKPAVKGPVRGGDGTRAGVEKRGLERGQGPSTRDGPRRKKVFPKPSPTGTGPDRGPRPNPNAKPSKPLPKKVFTPAEQKKNLKKITLENFKKLTIKERKMMGLPTDQAAAARLLGRPRGTPIFIGGFKQSSNMNKGGMAKKKGYAAGGMPMVMKGGKKVPSFAADGIGKMNMGGMAKKKPAAKMMAGGMAKKKPTAKMMGGGMAKSGYMYGGSVTKKKPVTKMNKGGMTKKK